MVLTNGGKGRENIEENAAERLETIKFERYNVRQKIQVYKGMTTKELQQVMKATFGIEDDVSVVGVLPKVTEAPAHLKKNQTTPKKDWGCKCDKKKKKNAQRKKNETFELITDRQLDVSLMTKLMYLFLDHYIVMLSVALAFVAILANVRQYFYLPFFWLFDLLNSFLRDVYSFVEYTDACSLS
ncbi:hypothetical protein RFI_01149, partial [Reticulomyxa filosa]